MNYRIELPMPMPPEGITLHSCDTFNAPTVIVTTKADHGEPEPTEVTIWGDWKILCSKGEHGPMA